MRVFACTILGVRFEGEYIRSKGFEGDEIDPPEPDEIDLVNVMLYESNVDLLGHLDDRVLRAIVGRILEEN